jgi:hypothetical protein
MTQDEEKQERRGFKVEDRRRFAETGEARPQAAEEPTAHAAQEAAAATAGPTPDAPPPLDINFSTFVISLSTQALAHLGEIAHPIGGEVAVDLGAAKQLIDILGVLKDKTRGNLDAAETGLLDQLLYDLRLRYVERARERSARA